MKSTGKLRCSGRGWWGEAEQKKASASIFVSHVFDVGRGSRQPTSESCEGLMLTRGLEYIKRYVNTRGDFFLLIPPHALYNPCCVVVGLKAARRCAGRPWALRGMGRGDSPQCGINGCLAFTLKWHVERGRVKCFLNTCICVCLQ